MTRLRPKFAAAVALVSALAACHPAAPTTAHVPKPSTAPVITTAVSPTPRPSTIPSVAVTVTLTGHINLPAQIIANNGGSIIANNGSGRRLLETSQVPVANVTVVVLDAAGNPIPGTQTRTDANGTYTITAALPAHNLVVQADLGAKGAVQAVVPPGARTVDADLVSTLTTGYILDQYVKGDSKILDKLPADVDATTRAKAGAALTAVPDALTPAKVVAAVESLRKADKSFDDQMEAVRKLLIPAGQSDLGNGQIATEVALGPGMLATTPDGDVLIMEQAGSRVWALKAGRLLNLAGSGGVRPEHGEPDVEGQDATRVPLDPYRIAYDAAGRLIIAEMDRITRVDAQGKLHLVGSFGGASLRAMAPGDAEEVLAIASNGKTARLAAYAPGKPERVIKTFDGADLAYLLYQEEIGGLGQWDARGKLVFSGFTQDGKVERKAFDLTALTFGAPEVLAEADTTYYDAAGNRVEGHGMQITVTPAGGSPRVVTTKFEEQNLMGGTLAKDGTVYIAGQTRVYRVEADGSITPVAGQAGNGKGDANAISFNDPVGVAVAPDGTLFVSDAGTNQVVRVGTDHQAKPYAGIALKDIVGEPLEEGPALKASLSFPGAPHLDAAGNLYFIADLRRVVKVTPAGQAVTAYIPPEQPSDLAVAPDGTLFVSYEVTPTLVRVPPGGQAEALLTDPKGDNLHDMRLALGPDGTLYISGSGKLRTWTATGGVKLVRTDVRFDNLAEVLPDARGRLYFVSQGENTIYRYDDPANAGPIKVAGPGTTKFAGTGTDDGLAAPAGMTFDAAGNLVFADSGHKQVKKILAKDL